MILQKSLTPESLHYIEKEANIVSVIEADLTHKINKIDKKTKTYSLLSKGLLAVAALLLGVQLVAPKSVSISEIADNHAPVLKLTEKVEYTEKVTIPAPTLEKQTEIKTKSETRVKQQELTNQKDFEAINSKLIDWMNGSLGKVMSIMGLLIGLMLAVVKNSPMPAITGVTMAMFLNFGPAVIADILGTTPLTPVEPQSKESPAKPLTTTQEFKKTKEVERSISLSHSTLKCILATNDDCFKRTNYGTEFKSMVSKSIKENNSYSAYYTLISSTTQKEFNENLKNWKYTAQSSIVDTAVKAIDPEVSNKYTNVAHANTVKRLTLPIIFLCAVMAYYSRKKEKENNKNKNILQKVIPSQQ